MTWSLAFLIVGALFVVCTFALFMTVYIKELKREEKIIASYGETLKGGYIDLPLVYIDKAPVANQPPNPAPVEKKKLIN